jgi:hypothetical protein
MINTEKLLSDFYQRNPKVIEEVITEITLTRMFLECEYNPQIRSQASVTVHQDLVEMGIKVCFNEVLAKALNAQLEFDIFKLKRPFLSNSCYIEVRFCNSKKDNFDILLNIIENVYQDLGVYFQIILVS